MGTHVAASTKCLAGAATCTATALDDSFVLKHRQQCVQYSAFSGRLCQRESKFLSSSPTEAKIFVKGRRRVSGLSARRTSLFQTELKRLRSAQLDSEVSNSLSRCRDESRNQEILESGESTREFVSEAENENPTTSSVDSERGSFLLGRRTLLGAFSVGLSVVYSSSSIGVAGPGKKLWILGDSDPNSKLEHSGSDQTGSDQTTSEQMAPEETASRVYDATALGEPVAIGTAKDRVWKRLLENRVIYLGEAETVADADDRLLELEIVQILRDKCFEQQRGISLAFEAFPCPLQPQMNAYMNKSLTDEEFRVVASHLPDDDWLEYLPILQYCKTHGVRLVACGAPLEVLRTVQAKGVQALSRDDRDKYIPPAGGGYKFKSSPLDDSQTEDNLPNSSGPFGPGPYRFAQARVVEDYTMSQVVTQVISDGGAVGVLLVITGASHVQYGTRGMGLPAWIAKNKDMQKRTQAVILLNPEKQLVRKEGDLPEADFLWYSAAKVCTRNCFDRAEVAQVMGAAGRRPNALPQDLQVGLKQGLVAPEVLQSFFELEENPFMAVLTDRFQGLRERWLADPRFLQRLAIEEAVSITTTLIAQYQRRRKAFWRELDYVATDTIRGAVVDFFTVWLPAPRLSFREVDPEEAINAVGSFKGLLGSFPDNAFQRAQGGQHWGIGERIGGILVGGLKLFAVGFVSSVGTVAGANFVLKARKSLSPTSAPIEENKRSPIVKTALVYSSFLGTSANLRYQVIAGVVEHWIADYWLASQPLVGNVISFVARVANSYFGTGQWVDLARYAGLQAHGDSDKAESVSSSSSVEGELASLKTSLQGKSSTLKTSAQGESNVLETSEVFSTTSSSRTDDIAGSSSKKPGGGKDKAPVDQK